MPDDASVGATTVAADELQLVNGVTQNEPLPKAQRVRPVHGPDGDVWDTSDDHPLPVAAADVVAAIDTLATALGSSSPVALDQASLDALESITATLSGAVDISDRAPRVLGHVTPDAPGDLATALADGRKTVTTPGTAVALRATLACKWVQVVALKTNTQQVNVGGSGALATAGSSTGTPLDPGQSTTLPVNDAAKVFVDARVAGEGVSFTVGS